VIGILIVDGGRIVQFVMSCRVVGLDVELAAIGYALRLMAEAGETEVRADLIETDANLLCRDLWARCGFAPEGAGWTRSLQPLPWVPAHVRLVMESGPALADAAE